MSMAGAVGGLLCSAALDMARSQPPQDAVAQACLPRIAEATENYEKALRACVRERDDIRGKLDAAQAIIAKLNQTPPPPPIAPDAIRLTADIFKRLRPMSEGESDLTKALATIDGDVKSLLEERDTLRDALHQLQQERDTLRDAQQELQQDRDRAMARQLAALDKALHRPCALLTRVETGDGGYRIEGLLPGGAKAKDTLEQDLERAAPGAIRAVTVEPIEGEVCLSRLDQEWALAQTGGADASGPLEVLMTPGVRKLVGMLPSSEAGCSEVFAALTAAARLRHRLPSMDEEILLWANLDGEFALCRGTPPHDAQSWRMRPWSREGKAALLVVATGKAAGPAPPARKKPSPPRQR